jgi:LPXTG-motif cell wall-anchored protein
LPRLRSATAIAGAFVVMGLVTVGWAAAAAAATDNPAPTPTCTHEVGTVGYPKPAPSCTPDKPHRPGYAVDVVCRPDPHHVILQIVNRTHEDADFTLRLVGGEEKVEGTVPAKDDELVKVSWMSPYDRWLLRIDHEWLKVKAGEPKDCHKPTHSPSHSPSVSPSESPSASPSASPSGSPSTSPSASASPSSPDPTDPPDLPTTGVDVPALAGAGLGLIGAGAVALVLARRRRTLEG